jgi:hypothetical protein
MNKIGEIKFSDIRTLCRRGRYSVRSLAIVRTPEPVACVHTPDAATGEQVFAQTIGGVQQSRSGGASDLFDEVGVIYLGRGVAQRPAAAMRNPARHVVRCFLEEPKN